MEDVQRIGRGNHDHWQTPPVIAEMALRRSCAPLFSPLSIARYASYNYALDIGAGDGVWGKAFKVFKPESQLTGIEVRDVPPISGYTTWIQADFMNHDFQGKRFDFIFGNPPFVQPLLTNIIEKASSLLTDNGIMTFLLPYRFLWGKARYTKFFLDNKVGLAYVYLLIPRPSFSNNGRTENRGEYFIGLFQKNNFLHPKIDHILWKEPPYGY